MIFKIADGREYFYQWDIDRQIIVDDPTITEVHFCNRTDTCSLVVEVVDGVANVPNKLLQNGFDVRVFGYDGKATIHETTFEVKARTQPADYVYTETVVKSIDEILEAAETVTTTANEFYEFVEHHTLDITDDGAGNVDLVAVDCEGEDVDVDLSDYYTKTEVNELIENIDIPETDLAGYATETYVDEAVKNVKVDVDLTDYAKKTDIPDVSKFITSIPDEYVTETELEAKRYATKTELNDKANTNHTHTGYAKTTHTHDMADVNGLQKALNDRATQADIDKAIELHDHRYDYAPIEHSHGDEYAAKTHTHSYNNLLDKPTIPSVEGLATEKYVDDAIANIEITGGGGDVDLSNYYTKAETEALGYATEEYVNAAIASESSAVVIDATNITTDWTPAPEAAVEFAHNFYNGKYIDKPIYVFQFGKAYQVTEVYNAAGLVYLVLPAQASDTLSQVYYNKYVISTNSGSWKINSDQTVSFALKTDLTNYYTKEEVDEAIANLDIDIPEGGLPGAPLYQHTIQLSATRTSGYANPSAVITFICTQSTAFSFESFINYLYSNEMVLAASGTLINTSYTVQVPLDGVTATNESELILKYRAATNTTLSSFTVTTENLNTFTDNVVCIGSASVIEGGETDLTNYYTKEEVDEAIQTALSGISPGNYEDFEEVGF